MLGSFSSGPTRLPSAAAMAAFRPTSPPKASAPKVDDLRARRDTCPERDRHTEPPQMTWEAHMQWLATMRATHRQSACKGCTLFHIWTPTGPAAPPGEAVTGG